MKQSSAKHQCDEEMKQSSAKHQLIWTFCNLLQVPSRGKADPSKSCLGLASVLNPFLRRRSNLLLNINARRRWSNLLLSIDSPDLLQSSAGHFIFLWWPLCNLLPLTDSSWAIFCDSKIAYLIRVAWHDFSFPKHHSMHNLEEFATTRDFTSWNDSCGVRAHALSEWRLEPPP